MAVIKARCYEFPMSTLDMVKPNHFDALGNLTYSLERKFSELNEFLNKGKPYYAGLGIPVTNEEFKNILDVAFEMLGYDKVDRLVYEFDDDKTVATIRLKKEKTGGIYKIKYFKTPCKGTVYIWGEDMEDAVDKFHEVFKGYELRDISLAKGQAK